MTQFVKSLEQDFKPTTIVTIATTTMTLQKHLVSMKYLDDRCLFRFQITRPKESTKYCPTHEETRAILKALNSTTGCEWLFDATTALSHSGLRFGELAQLSSFDVDTKKGSIFVRDETFASDGTRSTKSGYSRVVPMHLPVLRIIERLLNSTSGDLLFRGPKGGKLRSDTFGRNLRKFALEPLSKEFPHPRFQTITAHSFRHFFASLCASNKTSEQTTMDWMGHRTSNMARYYYRSNHKAAVEMIQQFEDFTEKPPADGDSIT